MVGIAVVTSIPCYVYLLACRLRCSAIWSNTSSIAGSIPSGSLLVEKTIVSRRRQFCIQVQVAFTLRLPWCLLESLIWQPALHAQLWAARLRNRMANPVFILLRSLALFPFNTHPQINFVLHIAWLDQLRTFKSISQGPQARNLISTTLPGSPQVVRGSGYGRSHSASQHFHQEVMSVAFPFAFH